MLQFPEGQRKLTEDERILTIDTLAALTRHISISFDATDDDTWVCTRRVATMDPNAAWVSRWHMERGFSEPELPSTVTAGPLVDQKRRASADGGLPRNRPSVKPGSYPLQPLAPTPASLSYPGQATSDSVMRTRNHNFIHTRTVSRSNIDLSASTNTAPLFNGTNTAITLNPLFLKYLHKDADVSVPPAPNNGGIKDGQTIYHAKVYVLFFLAITLVHELAHAVWMIRTAPPKDSEFECPTFTPHAATATNSDSPSSTPSNNSEQMDIDPPHPKAEHEPFIASQRRPELGQAWETSVFGNYGFIEPLGQCSGRATTSGRRWGDLFCMGLGVRELASDTKETTVEVQRNGRREILPLARLHDEDAVEDEETMPMSAPRYTRVKIMPFDFVYQFFTEGFWWRMQRGGREVGGGERMGLREFVKAQMHGWTEVRRENVDWMCTRGARAADFKEWDMDRIFGEDEDDDMEEDESEEDEDKKEEEEEEEELGHVSQL